VTTPAVTPEITPAVTPEVTPVVPLTVTFSEKGFKNKVPCNWEIGYIDTTVYARNVVSGESFEGTMDEFNVAMRG
jgi:hypothetical protein